MTWRAGGRRPTRSTKASSGSTTSGSKSAPGSGFARRSRASRARRIGTITPIDRGTSVTWEAPDARYRWFGVKVTIGNRVTWTVEPRGQSALVSAHVWATFRSIPSRLLEPVFTRLLKGTEKDREHTRVELRYLKHLIEASPPAHRGGP